MVSVLRLTSRTMMFENVQTPMLCPILIIDHQIVVIDGKQS
jgi:hypothetical protein